MKVSQHAQDVLAAGAKLAEQARAAGGKLKKNDKGYAILAKHLSEATRRSIERSVPYKIVKGERDLAADEMRVIDEILGRTLPEAVTMPLVDWVTAGGLAEPTSQVPHGSDPITFAGPLPRGDYMALRVHGNSMDRICPDGAIIAVNRTDKQLVNGKPYVFSVKGSTTFKLWHADPPYLDPASWDGSHKPEFVTRKRDMEVVGRVVQALVKFD